MSAEQTAAPAAQTEDQPAPGGYGSLGQQMTGSGSAVFAIMPSFEYAAVVCNMLKENFPGIFIAKPI